MNQQPDLKKEVVVSMGIIDSDISPLIPFHGFTVAEHRKGGRFPWNPNEVELYSSAVQKNGRMLCRELLDVVKEMPVLNACALDHLFENVDRISREWEDKKILFPGTRYGGPDGREYIRYLFFLRGWGSYRVCVDSELNNEWFIVLHKVKF